MQQSQQLPYKLLSPVTSVSICSSLAGIVIRSVTVVESDFTLRKPNSLYVLPKDSFNRGSLLDPKFGNRILWSVKKAEEFLEII